MAKPRFYLDENVSPQVAEQLRRSGIDVVSVFDLDAAGDTDANHLQRAAAAGRVLCTEDNDFHKLHAISPDHAGIVFAEQRKTVIGRWVKFLRHLHETETAESLRGTKRHVQAVD